MRVAITLFISFFVIVSGTTERYPNNESSANDNSDHNIIVSYDLTYEGNPDNVNDLSLKFSSAFDSNM